MIHLADMLLLERAILAKSPPLLYLVMARVMGSDKLVNSNLSYRIKWMMAMALWLALLG